MNHMCIYYFFLEDVDEKTCSIFVKYSKKQNPSTEHLTVVRIKVLLLVVIVLAYFI